jgi:hypothetical protein
MCQAPRLGFLLFLSLQTGGLVLHRIVHATLLPYYPTTLLPYYPTCGTMRDYVRLCETM